MPGLFIRSCERRLGDCVVLPTQLPFRMHTSLVEEHGNMSFMQIKYQGINLQEKMTKTGPTCDFILTTTIFCNFILFLANSSGNALAMFRTTLNS